MGAHAAPRVTQAPAPSGTARASAVVHLFSVDVEEYFQVVALEPHVERSAWDGLPSRVEQTTQQILELLARRGATGTFFTLGWVADRYPSLVRQIRDAGHEVASHGYGHERITGLAPEVFREDVRRARRSLEDACGSRVEGYRAPSFSIVRGREWAFDILIEEGYTYDSSVFPIRRRGYGYSGAPSSPYIMRRPAGDLLELPLATLAVAGARLPAAGGAYLRLLPPALCHAAFKQASERGNPGMFYVHPWEVDDGQPRFDVPLLTRIRHYGMLGGTMARLDGMLAAFRFQSVAAWRATAALGELPVLSGPAAAA